MTKNPQFTEAELADAKKLAKTIEELPQDKKAIVVMMTNAFIHGMEASESLAPANS